VEIANKVGAAEIIGRVVDDLKDEAEQYRKMVMETIEKVDPRVGRVRRTGVGCTKITLNLPYHESSVKSQPDC